jgi:anaerobic selenocysteine-containing dehydrogenase
MSSDPHFRTCPLCEATCGLEITMNGGGIASVRGDSEDVFSHGYICPKGTAVKALHEDPDRLRRPLVRDGDKHKEVSWEEAYAAIDQGLAPIIAAGDKDAIGAYVGNPSVHSLSATVMLIPLLRAMGSKNIYTAATVDQMPKHVSSGLMFGSPTLIPVPDIDLTDYIVVLGANPWTSNGSLATAPDFRGRLQAISKRGGKVVVVDPRRTETAAGADEHIFIRPGSDAFFLLAMVSVLFEEGLVDLRDLEGHVTGVDEVKAAAARFTPEGVADITGIDPGTTRRIARELAAAASGCVYDRVGAHQQEFGTLASWASDVLTALTGNLDRPGGKLFPLAAHGHWDPDEPNPKGWRTGRFTSRVKGYTEAFGQLPVATLADEIETPGAGQIKALITIAGNPVLSTPNGGRLDRALATLDFMVAIDPFLNETTRHADVILPPDSILARHHYDFAFYGLSVRNVANYSPPLVPAEGPDEWELLSRLTLAVSGQSAADDPEVVPQMALAFLVQESISPGGSLEGRDPAEIIAAVAHRDPVQRILDFRLRSGPYGDLFGTKPDGISLQALKENPHGIDLGPLKPRLPNALKTTSCKVELAPDTIVDDVPRLAEALTKPVPETVLIGRRHVRTNNSWMHNVPAMQGGSNTCAMKINPDDAARIGLTKGSTAKVSSRVGEVEVDVEITDEMMPGVVSIPHGWGHSKPDIALSVASANPGVSVNDLTDDAVIDPLSGNAALNAVPVEVTPTDEKAELESGELVNR